MENDKVSIINGGLAVDDRGSVLFVNGFDFKDVKRFYQLSNHDINYIRAWHGHKKEGKYVYVSKGSILVGVVNLDTEKVQKFILSDKSPKVLWIPPGYANGFMNLEQDTRVLFFSTSSLEESLSDDIRFNYDKWNIWDKDYR